MVMGTQNHKGTHQWALHEVIRPPSKATQRLLSYEAPLPQVPLKSLDMTEEFWLLSRGFPLEEAAERRCGSCQGDPTCSRSDSQPGGFSVADYFLGLKKHRYRLKCI